MKNNVQAGENEAGQRKITFFILTKNRKKNVT